MLWRLGVNTEVADCRSTPLHEAKVLWELPRYSLEFLQQGGVLQSKDYTGYQLAQSQQLAEEVQQQQQQLLGLQGPALYTLPNFQQYLLLQRGPHSGSHTTSGARLPDKKVLVPSGSVVCATHPTQGQAAASHQPGSLEQVQLPRGSADQIKAHVYEVHARFGDLRSPSKLARLQLAALYSATSSLLTEPLSRATGVQTALQLLRQCWGNVPLTQQQQLKSVASLGGHLASGLRLMVSELLDSSTQVAHLHSGANDTNDNLDLTAASSLDPDASSCYLDPEESAEGVYNGWCSNPRMLLTPDEERRVLRGWRRTDPSPPIWFRSGKCRTVQVQPCPEAASLVSQVEADICSCVQEVPQASACPAYPLSPLGTLSLEGDMHKELAASWKAWQGIPTHQLSISHKELRRKTKAWQARVSPARSQVEAYLLHSLDLVPPENPHGCSFRMLRAAGGAARPGLLDLARVAVSPDAEEALRPFNPFLTRDACKKLVQGINVWLQVCVLEDRLERLVHLTNEDNMKEMEPTLIKELQVKRVWAPLEHPKWLVFEVEGQLQIRPTKYCIAKHLLSNPGHISQLNMGEGKTRVILPMMALHWTDGKEGAERLVRLNLLSTLLDEAYAYLSIYLTASVQCCKLFTMPFHRGVDLTTKCVDAMIGCLEHCQQVGGLLLVAPEHRLSLELK